MPLSLLILESDGLSGIAGIGAIGSTADDLGTLNDVCQMALLVVGAYATGYGAVLREGVAHAEAYHRILVLGTFGEIA